jgi:predicted ATPase/DNA-binding SARP family transcriptional activator
MQVAILGPLTVAGEDAHPIEIGGARLRALLIRLAADAQGWVSVGELVQALWDEAPPGDELNALQSLVSRLRRALPTPELIESGPAGYRLAIDPESVDAIRFERLADRGRRQQRDGHQLEAFTVLTEALALWRGAALTEVAGAPYAVAWGERLDKLRATVVDNRAAAGLQLGRHAELIAELERVTAGEPLRERSHELLIRALAGTGRQREALAVYSSLRANLSTELGLDPPAHLQELHLAVLRNDPALQPEHPPETREPAPKQRRSNLRSPLTSFIGRDDEVRQLRIRLEEGRLITLLGPGGAGKTRLAGEVASGVRGIGTDGVWMIELAPVTDPDDLASTALGALGSRDPALMERHTVSHRDTLSRLVDTLADHDIVLILDNCEHLVDAAAKLAEYLLGQCPRLTVLATSREPLGIVGESLWPVTPLGSPEAADSLTTLLSRPSVRLFADRAALVRPGFTVNLRNAAAVSEICRRLDGLPLAIELAAARLRSLPIDTVAARLSNRFGLLTGGNRTALPRHQTLRAVVAWSWDLLNESERRLAERLSVFPGGATGTSVEAVCLQVGDELLADAVPDLLAALADKSLLVTVDDRAEAQGEDQLEPAEPRYRMLETIREFATERLAERGETRRLKQAHAQYFLALAETAEPALRGSDQLIWLHRLTVERDNLLATLRFSTEIGDADTAIRLGAALSWYWTLLGRHDEAAIWLGQALSVPGESPAEAFVIVTILREISAAASGFGMPTPERIQQVTELVERFDGRVGHPLIALAAPGIAMITDDNPAAEAAVRRNLTHPDPWVRASLQMMSAMMAENEGDLERLEHHLPLALEGFRQIGDRWGTGAAVSSRAMLYAAHGDTQAAIAALAEAQQMMSELRANDDEAYTIIRIGMMRMRLLDLAGARRDIEAGLRMSDNINSPTASAYARYALAGLAQHEGDLDQARRLADEALQFIERAPFAPPQVKGVSLCQMAALDIAQGRFAEAHEGLKGALECARISRDMPVFSMVSQGAADLMMAEENPARGSELLGVAVRLRGIEDVGDLDVQRLRAAGRAALGVEEFDRLHARGRDLDRGAALALLESSL